MKNENNITTLFIDIGGVLLTDGWNRQSRKNAAAIFNLELQDLEDRHHLSFDTYEIGKITLDEYLKSTIFYKTRSFTIDEFKTFMFAQSEPFNDMLQLIKQLKEKYQLKVVVVSNEGRELTAYRINKFKLNDLIDFFVSSCFVRLRKPDIDIFKLAIDLAQTPVEKIIYIEDRLMFVEMVESLGIKSIHHIDYQSTVDQLTAVGFHS